MEGNLKLAEINYDKAQRNFKSISKNLVYNVTAGFYRLYQAKENVEIAKENVKQTENSNITAENKLKAALIAEVDALQLEVDLASSRNDLLTAEKNYSEAKNNFVLQIGLKLDDSINVSANLKYEPVQINPTEAINYALENRSELKNAEDEIEESKMTVDEISSL